MMTARDPVKDALPATMTRRLIGDHFMLFRGNPAGTVIRKRKSWLNHASYAVVVSKYPVSGYVRSRGS